MGAGAVRKTRVSPKTPSVHERRDKKCVEAFFVLSFFPPFFFPFFLLLFLPFSLNFLSLFIFFSNPSDGF